LRIQCTRSQSAGRTLKRHERQEILDDLRLEAQSRSSKRDIQVRQHFMERSFAHGTRFGLKRARWRGRWLEAAGSCNHTPRFSCSNFFGLRMYFL
jgi:hypothetical protein